MSTSIFSNPVGIRERVHNEPHTNKFVGLDDMPVDASLMLARVHDYEDIPSDHVFNQNKDGSDVTELWSYVSEKAKERYGKNWRHHLYAFSFFCTREAEGKKGNFFFSYGPKAIKAGTHSLFMGRFGSSPRLDIKANRVVRNSFDRAPRWRGF